MMSYPTDEELAEWITEIEKKPLYVPGYLKEEILKSLEKQDLRSVRKQRQNQIQMFAYSLKIVIGMAAALFLIFLLPGVPADHQWKVPEEQRREWEAREPEGAAAVFQKGNGMIREVSYSILDKINMIHYLFDKEN